MCFCGIPYTKETAEIAYSAGKKKFKSIESVIAGVAAGMGISFLPISILERYTDAKSVRTYNLPDKYPAVTLTANYRKDLLMNKACEEFKALLTSGK